MGKQIVQSNHKLDLALTSLQERIDSACQAAGRHRDAITLIGATKTQSISTINQAYRLGLRHFGENYLDEAIEKITTSSLPHAIWHYIGRIQSNKTRLIATHFDWVQTIDREKIAQRLNNHCPPGKSLQVLIQVNVDRDPAKGGVAPQDCEALLAVIMRMPNLCPRGLMTILSQGPQANPVASYRSMAQLAQQLRSTLPATYDHWDTLSMGMTADLEAAIDASATHIRIGTALFGERAGAVAGDIRGT